MKNNNIGGGGENNNSAITKRDIKFGSHVKWEGPRIGYNHRGESDICVVYITGKWNTWSKKAIETAIAAAATAVLKPMGIHNSMYARAFEWVTEWVCVQCGWTNNQYIVLIVLDTQARALCIKYTSINKLIQTCLHTAYRHTHQIHTPHQIIRSTHMGIWSSRADRCVMSERETVAMDRERERQNERG